MMETVYVNIYYSLLFFFYYSFFSGGVTSHSCNSGSSHHCLISAVQEKVSTNPAPIVKSQTKNAFDVSRLFSLIVIYIFFVIFHLIVSLYCILVGALSTVRVKSVLLSIKVNPRYLKHHYTEFLLIKSTF